jgi:hypothetical protein
VADFVCPFSCRTFSPVGSNLAPRVSLENSSVPPAPPMGTLGCNVMAFQGEPPVRIPAFTICAVVGLGVHRARRQRVLTWPY